MSNFDNNGNDELLEIEDEEEKEEIIAAAPVVAQSLVTNTTEDYQVAKQSVEDYRQTYSKPEEPAVKSSSMKADGDDFITLHL